MYFDEINTVQEYRVHIFFLFLCILIITLRKKDDIIPPNHVTIRMFRETSLADFQAAS